MGVCGRPALRDEKSGWYACHRSQVNSVIRSQASVVILGDSLVAGLARYPSVWDPHLKPLNAIQCGIGGDCTQHVLWRVENFSLPDSVHVVVLLCGTNNIDHDLPLDIAEAVMSCGIRLRERYPHLHVVIAGILPRDLNLSSRREKIRLTNEHLKHLVNNKPDFTFIEQSCYWTEKSGQLDKSLYYKDHLHLVQPGYQHLAMQLASVLISLSKRTSSMTCQPTCHRSLSQVSYPRPSSPPPSLYQHHAPLRHAPTQSPIIYHRCHRPRRPRSQPHLHPPSHSSSSSTPSSSSSPTLSSSSSFPPSSPPSSPSPSPTSSSSSSPLSSPCTPGNKAFILTFVLIIYSILISIFFNYLFTINLVEGDLGRDFILGGKQTNFIGEFYEINNFNGECILGSLFYSGEGRGTFNGNVFTKRMFSLKRLIVW